MRQILAAWVFYTRLPLPFLHINARDFQGIARWVPLVGLGIGVILVLVDLALRQIAPDPVRAVGVLWIWISLTGGFHLDGVADTADGLSVDAHDQEGQQRRLAVMSDSRVGALGVVALILVMMIKFAALISLASPQWPYLLLAPAWGRWGQLLAIAAYPYLKPQGQGRLLKDFTQPLDLVPMSLVLIVLILILGQWTELALRPLILWSLITAAVSGGLGWRLARRLGGHTGDTYGAVVEWTEALGLLLTQIN